MTVRLPKFQVHTKDLLILLLIYHFQRQAIHIIFLFPLIMYGVDCIYAINPMSIYEKLV